jgi:ABC-type sugar transport system permease subunit
MEIWHWYPLTFLVLFSGFANLPISEIRAAEILARLNGRYFGE